MFSTEKSVLLVIDVQGKLADLVIDSTHLIQHIQVLTETANYLDIPIIYTEQVPEKIGATVDSIAKNLKDIEPITKRTFSCCGEQRFLQELASHKRDEIIITGIETHVCVYQTVYDLLHQNYNVKVVKDAVSSRKEKDYQTALQQMELMGAKLTTTEMMICELIKGADHARFKDIMKFLKQ